jgi:hypothetical protein
MTRHEAAEAIGAIGLTSSISFLEQYLPRTASLGVCVNWKEWGCMALSGCTEWTTRSPRASQPLKIPNKTILKKNLPRTALLRIPFVHLRQFLTM